MHTEAARKKLFVANSTGQRFALLNSSADMNFAAGSYFGGTVATMLSTTRASTGYAQTSSGLLVPFAANTPRITDQGLLVEEARTNSSLYSYNATAGANWSRSAVSTSDAQTGAPDGTATASSVTAQSGSANHYLYQTAGFTATVAAWTISAYVKPVAGRWFALSFGSNATADGAFFDLQAGTVGTVAASSTATIASYANGWFRVSVTRTLTGTTRYVQVEPHGADNQAQPWNAAGTESFLVWGAQAELGAFPTSYIPTTTASATRAADSIIANMAWLNSTALSLYAKGTPQSPSTYGTNQVIATLDDGTAINRVGLYRNAANGSGATFITPGSFDQAIAAWADNTSRKIAISTVAGTQLGSFNGASAVTPGVAAQPTGINRLSIGQRSAGSSQYWNGYIQRLTVFQSALSQTQLNALTSP